MAILIGKVEPGFEDPIGLMTACHRRIERFLGVLRRIARNRQGGELGREDADALGTALRYFREAAPHHTADEEEGLFPVLTRVEAGVAKELADLERDHRRADQLHAEVDRIGLEWLQAGTLPEEKTLSLEALLDELASIYREHIQAEEQKVFPLALRVLPPAAIDLLGQEMAARRGVSRGCNRS
jgi:hemerythrin-like domain-containing protein